MAAARMWVERWERQQQHHAVDREERFTVIADVIEHITADRPRPHLLDLGCGPGSLGLARTHHAGAARYVDAVIGDDGWIDALGLDRPLDAAVSTTALHYLAEPVLLSTYRRLARLLRPGGAVVNGDHFPPGGPPCSNLTAHVGRRRAERSRTHIHENWQSWWTAAAQDPALADLFTERKQRRPSGANGSGGDNGLTAARHAELLRQAGFRHVVPVWQFGDSQVLVAING